MKIGLIEVHKSENEWTKQKRDDVTHEVRGSYFGDIPLFDEGS